MKYWLQNEDVLPVILRWCRFGDMAQNSCLPPVNLALPDCSCQCAQSQWLSYFFQNLSCVFAACKHFDIRCCYRLLPQQSYPNLFEHLVWTVLVAAWISRVVCLFSSVLMLFLSGSSLKNKQMGLSFKLSSFFQGMDSAASPRNLQIDHW